jgi:hypothetical protein
MSLKKHNININVTKEATSEQSASSFLVDLRTNTPKNMVSLKEDQIAALEELAQVEVKNYKENLVKDDWLDSRPLPNPTSPKGFAGRGPSFRLKKINLTPLLKIFKIFTPIYNFFIVDTLEIIRALRQKRTGGWPRLKMFLTGIKLNFKKSKTKPWQSLFLDKFNYFKNNLAKEKDNVLNSEVINRVLARRAPRNRWRWLLYFILVLLLLILPFKLFSYYNLFDFQREIFSDSEEAVNNLLTASESAANLNLDQATLNFSRAGDNFFKVSAEIKNIDQLILKLASLSQNKKIKIAGVAPEIARVGEISSSLGRNLSLALDIVIAQKPQGQRIESALEKFVYYGQAAVIDAKNLNLELAKIDIKYIPDEYRDKFLATKEKVSVLEKGLVEFISLAEGLHNFLGVNYDKRYLLVFQNNNEARASGGFIGSYALVDLREGQIKNIEVPEGGSYDTEGGARVLMEAPEPLHLVSSLWRFWNANWWSDWKLSAQNLAWFYEKSDGPTVDGVITFTPNVLEGLLKITGPIDMTKDYGVMIDSQNFWEVTQGIVEKIGNPEYYASSSPHGEKLDDVVKNNSAVEAIDKNKPKKIIGDLMNQIMEKLPQKLNKENLVKILNIVDVSLKEKQVMFYFKDEELQAKMEKNSWAGRVKNTSGDYLAVVNTNIAGGKSDRKMAQKVIHNIDVQADNSIIDTVSIYRTHTGLRGEPFSGVRNVDWMRVYVPRGSQLLEASGFTPPDPIYFDTLPDPSWQKNELVEKTEGRAKIDLVSGAKVYMESNKTVFAGWLMVDPGQTGVVTFKYRLPFKLRLTEQNSDLFFTVNRWLNPDYPKVYKFSLLVQKQPGSLNGEYESNLSFDKNYKIFWRYPLKSGIMESGWNIKDTMGSDKFYSTLLKDK